jgi:AcrR family transcriptional regulator
MADARSERTLAALRAAILELASEVPVSQVSVTDVTTRAGINRATFYSHFSSPTLALVAALNADLDHLRIREKELAARADLTSEDVIRVGITGVVEHILRFEAIYRLVLQDTGDTVMHHALCAHFAESLQQILQRLRPPDVPNHVVASQFVAHGLVGAIEIWLQDPRISQEELVDTVLATLPAWWLD